MSTYRYGRKTKKTYLKRKTKKVTDLYEKVKEYVLFLRDCDLDIFEKEIGHNQRTITKEFVAKKFQVKEHEIRQCFDRLNQERILSQPTKRAPHDTTRDFWGFGGVSGWAANEYSFMDPYENWKNLIWKGEYEAVEKKIKRGLNVNSKIGRESGLFTALKEEDLRMISLLLQHGSDPTYYNSIETLECALKNATLATFKTLMEYASNPKVEDEEGNDLFLLACKENDVEKVKWLLQNDFSLTKRNHRNETALIIATKHNNTNVVSYLLSQNVNWKTKDSTKKTAFMYAMEMEHKEILRLFIPFRHELTRDEKKAFKHIRMRLLF